MSRYQSFEEFWPFYVREHSRKETRVLHFAGTSAALGTLAAALLLGRPKLAAIAPVLGYGPAWISHFFIEKNRPATFKYPLWSLMADFVMLSKMVAGTMDAEVERAMAQAEAETNPPSPPADSPAYTAHTNGASTVH